MDPDPADAQAMKGKSGLGRLLSAFRNSMAGFRYAIAAEDAIRQELILLAMGVPLAIALHVSTIERLILIIALMFLLVVEMLNTAVEATVDRIGLERHPLAGRAKDLGSAAVLTAVVIAGLCWVVIAGPLLVRWLQG